MSTLAPALVSRGGVGWFYGLLLVFLAGSQGHPGLGHRTEAHAGEVLQHLLAVILGRERLMHRPRNI
jgi:hypothetical protein